MNTKEKILHVAERMFADKGFDGVSIRDITAEANVNLGAVTYYFETKEKLILAILQKKVDPMVKTGRNIIAGNKTATEKLRAIMEMYANQILYVDPYLRVMFSELLTGGKRLPQEVKDSVSLRNKMFMHVMKEGVTKGEFRKCDLECAAWTFFGMMSSYILYQPLAGGVDRLKPYPKSYVDRVINCAMDIFINGVSIKKKAK